MQPHINMVKNPVDMALQSHVSRLVAPRDQVAELSHTAWAVKPKRPSHSDFSPVSRAMISRRDILSS